MASIRIACRSARSPVAPAAGFRNGDIGDSSRTRSDPRDLAHEIIKARVSPPEPAQARRLGGAPAGSSASARWRFGHRRSRRGRLGCGCIGRRWCRRVTGGLVGGLIGAGIPEVEAKRYAGQLREGRMHISVHCDDSKWAKKGERSSGRLAAGMSRRRRKRQPTTNRNGACWRGASPPRSRTRPLLRRQPSDIRRDIQDVIVGELRDRSLHQRRVGSVAIAFLEEIGVGHRSDVPAMRGTLPSPFSPSP